MIGLMQIPEDLHFILRMRHMFESLGYQSGFFLSQLFSSNRAPSATTNSPSSSSGHGPMKQTPARPPPPIFNWTTHPLPSAATAQFHPQNFHPNNPQLGLQPPPPNTSNKDNTHLFLLPHQSDHQMPDQHETDLKWPNGLSFFTALTGRPDESKLLFGHDHHEKSQQIQSQHQQQHPLVMASKNMQHSSLQMNLCTNTEERDNSNTEDYLGLESTHSNKVRKMESSSSSSSNKFKRSFTMPARMATSSSSSSLDQHQNQQQQQQGMDQYRSSEAGIYSDIMETFLE